MAPAEPGAAGTGGSSDAVGTAGAADGSAAELVAGLPAVPAPAAGAPSGTVAVEVAYSLGPRRVDLVRLVVPAGSTLGEVLARSGLLERHGLDPAAVQAGIWSRLQPPSATVRHLDRIEIYRGLLVDPKEARRLRYKGSARKRRQAVAEG